MVFLNANFKKKIPISIKSPSRLDIEIEAVSRNSGYSSSCFPTHFVLESLDHSNIEFAQEKR